MAHATQPLEQFIAGAKSRNFDAREQAVTKEQSDWDKAAALGRLLPSFTARGTYTRNQYEIKVALPGSTQEIVISPYNQLDAQLQIDVPIIDVANYYRYKQAKNVAEAQTIQARATGNEVDKAVSRAYFSFLGASALLESAQRTLKIADENAVFVSTRREAGVATDLDLERAKANVEQSKQNIADAELSRSLAARQLETLSGITPTLASEFPEDDLGDEGDLNRWVESQDNPSDKVQAKLQEAAVSGKRAAAYSLLPTLTANAQERLTNATAFTGRWNVYALQAVLSWRLDYSTYASAQSQSAAGQLAKVRAEKNRRAIEDSVFDAFKRVEAGIVKSRSARAQAVAARKAADLASERYQAGASTQLDVTQAQRDYFMAEANRIQADADLAYSRIALRVAAGQQAKLAHQRPSTLPQDEPITPPAAATAPSADPNP